MNTTTAKSPEVKAIWGGDRFFFDGWGGKSVHFPNVGPYKKLGLLWVSDDGQNVVFRCNFCDRKSVLSAGEFSCSCGGAEKQ